MMVITSGGVAATVVVTADALLAVVKPVAVSVTVTWNASVVFAGTKGAVKVTFAV